MEIYALPAAVAAMTGYTHQALLTHEDLTEATADTDQEFDFYLADLGTLVGRVAFQLDETFEDESDAALNDTKVSIGDEDSGTRFLAAQQVNENGTTVLAAGSNNAYAFVAAKTCKITVESMTGKSLVNIDKGSMRLFFEIADLSRINL